MTDIQGSMTTIFGTTAALYNVRSVTSMNVSYNLQEMRKRLKRREKIAWFIYWFNMTDFEYFK